MVTTLDAAVRLNRYLFEELWTILFKNPPALLRHYWFNSGLSVVLMLLLAWSNAFNALWPIFGTANQLLAALGLLAVSGWLLLRGRRYAFALVPAVFMIATTMASLAILLRNYVRSGNWILVVTDVLMMVLGLGVAALAAKKFLRPAPAPAPAKNRTAKAQRTQRAFLAITAKSRNTENRTGNP